MLGSICLFLLISPNVATAKCHYKTLNYIKEITTMYYENIRIIILINCHASLRSLVKIVAETNTRYI
jgi:hypothetical protein